MKEFVATTKQENVEVREIVRERKSRMRKKKTRPVKTGIPMAWVEGVQ